MCRPLFCLCVINLFVPCLLPEDEHAPVTVLTSGDVMQALVGCGLDESRNICLVEAREPKLATFGETACVSGHVLNENVAVDVSKDKVVRPCRNGCA